RDAAEQVVHARPPVVEDLPAGGEGALPIAAEEGEHALAGDAHVVMDGVQVAADVVREGSPGGLQRIPAGAEVVYEARGGALDPVPRAAEELHDLPRVRREEGPRAEEVGGARGGDEADGRDDPPHGPGEQAEGGADTREEAR